MSFEARYPGHCHACDTRITVGETVTYTEDDELIHHGCLTGERDEPRPVICPECWTDHKGECA